VEGTEAGLSRRRFIKTAATVAWVTPVVLTLSPDAAAQALPSWPVCKNDSPHPNGCYCGAPTNCESGCCCAMPDGTNVCSSPQSCAANGGTCMPTS
jgi:hypothetical protein